MAKVTPPVPPEPQQRRPAITAKAREQQLTALAVDLAEQQLMDGTASSQVITHYLKIAASDYQLKIERLEEENKLLRAKTEAIEAQTRLEPLIQQAMAAFKTYSGRNGDDDEY